MDPENRNRCEGWSLLLECMASQLPGLEERVHSEQHVQILEHMLLKLSPYVIHMYQAKHEFMLSSPSLIQYHTGCLTLFSPPRPCGWPSTMGITFTQVTLANQKPLLMPGFAAHNLTMPSHLERVPHQHDFSGATPYVWNSSATQFVPSHSDSLPPRWSFAYARLYLPSCKETGVAFVHWGTMLNMNGTHKFSSPEASLKTGITNDVLYFFLLLAHVNWKMTQALTWVFTDACHSIALIDQKTIGHSWIAEGHKVCFFQIGIISF